MGRFRCRKIRGSFSRLLTCCMRGEPADRDSERSESRTPSPTVTVHMDIPLTGAVTVNTATGAGAGNADDEGQSTDTFSITDGQSSTTGGSVTSHDHDTSPVYSTTECSDKDEIKSAVEVFMASLLERVLAKEGEDGESEEFIDHSDLENTTPKEGFTSDETRPPSDEFESDAVAVTSDCSTQPNPEDTQAEPIEEDSDSSVYSDIDECTPTSNDTRVLLPENTAPQQSMLEDGSASEKSSTAALTDSGICCEDSFTTESNSECSDNSSCDSQVGDGVIPSDTAADDDMSVSQLSLVESVGSDRAKDDSVDAFTESVQSETASSASLASLSTTEGLGGREPHSEMFLTSKHGSEEQQDGVIASPKRETLSQTSESKQVDAEKVRDTLSCSEVLSGSLESTQQSSDEQQAGVRGSNQAECTEDKTVSGTEQGGEKRTPTLSHCDVLHGESDQPNSAKGQRSRDVFEVTLVSGLLGLGLTVRGDDFQDIVIQKIRMFSSAATQGELRVGDRILKINGSSVVGKSPAQVQRLLSGVKWGEEVKLLAMPAQELVAFHFSEMANAGVIVIKLNTAFDKPLGIDVEGGTDTDSPYIRISNIKPGFIADKCGMLQVGDELVQIDKQLMVGITHFKAIDILGHIYKPITLAVQRRQDLNIMDRISHSEQEHLE